MSTAASLAADQTTWQPRVNPWIIGVAVSLAAIVVVYLIVFGAGLLFVLRLLWRPPTVGESGPPTGLPIRAAGITPAPGLAAPAPHDGGVA